VRALELASLALGRAAVAAHVGVRRVLDRRLPGVGRVLRLTRGEHVIGYRGLSWALRGEDAASYFMMLAGRSNEPETLAFLEAVLGRAPAPVTFVDVGANVGEFLLDAGRHPAVAAAVGFEPHPASVEACRRSIRLNGLAGRVRIVPKAVRDRAGTARLHVAPGNSRASSVVAPPAAGRGDWVEVPATTLDGELAGVDGTVLMLVDVEGAEPLVLAGGRRLLERTLPLVVFEHNETSRRLYGLDAVRAALPAGYELLRLRGDGRLDRDLERTWNCVAVHPASPLAAAARELEAEAAA